MLISASTARSRATCVADASDGRSPARGCLVGRLASAALHPEPDPDLDLEPDPEPDIDLEDRPPPRRVA